LNGSRRSRHCDSAQRLGVDMRWPSTVLLVGMIVLCACVPKTKQEVNTLPAVEPEARVDSFFQSYIQAFNSRDMQKLAEHYSPDAEARVFRDSQSYLLDKQALLSAFEMKKGAWESNNVMMEDYSIVTMQKNGSLMQSKVVFKIASEEWTGSYPVYFELMDSEEGILIVKENTK